ncbi:HPr family phosphocarrier protein [Intestinimonas massiliensis (ex Afouda et al. 2020)]|uniref:HPr family phosphocarrier protein n=1 Tax=Intestinimonas massiliensis (ex Afouda et al. 2020) TaxID=1673721 RepID=UPI00102FAE1A|nr:HPr family phosphocarrier protein [Intestinimonas massiliensis (ex Afouda et al. 2020)]
MLTEKVTVCNPSGLHARPASAFVQTTGKFKSKVAIRKDGEEYNAKSIISILRACVKYQEEVEVVVNGDDEAEALSAIVAAIKGGLGEKILT